MANAAPLRLIVTNISPTRYGVLGGAEGIRTPDPLHAMQVRYQLRHSPDALNCAGVESIAPAGRPEIRALPR